MIHLFYNSVIDLEINGEAIEVLDQVRSLIYFSNTYFCALNTECFFSFLCDKFLLFMPTFSQFYSCPDFVNCCIWFSLCKFFFVLYFHSISVIYSLALLHCLLCSRKMFPLILREHAHPSPTCHIYFLHPCYYN